MASNIVGWNNCSMDWLARRREQREQKAREAAGFQMQVFLGLIHNWMTLGFDSDFSRRTIQEARSEGMAIEEVLASIHEAGFDSFCELFSEEASRRGLKEKIRWDGNERAIYDLRVREFLEGRFGADIARATMRHVEYRDQDRLEPF